MIYMLRNMQKVNTLFPNYDPPIALYSRGKPRKFLILAKGGGVPPDQYISGFFPVIKHL